MNTALAMLAALAFASLVMNMGLAFVCLILEHLDLIERTNNERTRNNARRDKR